MTTSSLAPAGTYSVANARRFGWASVSTLNTERVDLLARYVIGPRVLDAGCGGGGYVDHLCRRGLDATGVDKHGMFLDLAAERGLAGRFVQADLTERLPFPDGWFDTTFCFDVLEHVDDVAALRELARVTRARLIVTVPRDGSRLEEDYHLLLPPYKDATHLRYYSEDMVRELAATVHPSSVTIRPEGLVEVRRFIRDYGSPRSRWPVLGGLYRRAFDFLTRRMPASDLSINWLAVIDLGVPLPAGGGV